MPAGHSSLHFPHSDQRFPWITISTFMKISADPAAQFHLLCPPISCTPDPALTRPPPSLPHPGPAACSWISYSSWRVSACRVPPSALENTPPVAPLERGPPARSPPPTHPTENANRAAGSWYSHPPNLPFSSVIPVTRFPTPSSTPLCFVK
ncbi:uncharacterized protein LOC118470036 [Amphiprion ocellaris]|uniref:uncharacterized protein LOC118470036 n=1 Tax=Amphiprion ocellaris TaxID=80972 RepID=UPI0024118F5E|nr:uncharacterized protein LOC118470036 [Amphiprion ocellaris]